jgi:NAD(P)H-dependent flavin oxidoreductase YrpB (nitropropane dioxygenase family)
VAALCGSPHQAKKHVEAGVDVVIGQGGEGGGHTGEVGSIVLWPQIARAIAPTPLLAAGGIGSGEQVAAALAMGAQGVWAGSLWLTVEEADLPPAQKQQLLDATSRDTVRSRSFTGKPCRMIRTEWTDAWDRPDTPDPLPMPLQYMVSGDCVARGHRYADKALDVMFNPVGQVVGQLDRVEKAADVVRRLVEEYLEAVDRLNALNATAAR